MRNGVYCYLLTVIDHFSRYLLCRYGLLDVAAAGVRPPLRHLFRTYGLPEAIRSDNGAPFASTGIHGLNRLNVWWPARRTAPPSTTGGWSVAGQRRTPSIGAATMKPTASLGASGGAITGPPPRLPRRRYLGPREKSIFL